jgi:hypothetical protein
MATRNPLQGSLWAAAEMLSRVAVGANAPAGPPEPSKEMRAKMATLYEHSDVSALRQTPQGLSRCVGTSR